MSNKSGTSPQVISLPTGGGAVQGVGEKFSPNLHTGTGTITIPIALPPGRNGFQPTLNLVYSSGQGNGPFGMGWALDVPGVSRKTSKGIPVYDDAKDVFVLSGIDDLVPIARRAGSTRYRPRIEGVFAEIDHHRDPGADDHWEIRTKDGFVSLYGTPQSVGDDPATVAQPTDPTRIFGWKLTKTTDPFGNCIEYAYERLESDAGDPQRWRQIYLSEVRYVDYGSRADPRFLVRVRFVYEARPDPVSDHRAGFAVRTTRRCARIDVSTHAGADVPVRTYHLTYADSRGLPADRLPLNGVSLLSDVRVEGHDGAASEWLPPLEFGYTLFQPQDAAKRDLLPMTGDDPPPASLAHPEFEMADVTGDGLPDIVEMNGAVRVWRNLGGGRFDLPRDMPDAPAGVSLAQAGVQLLDIDGDGRIDLLDAAGPFAGYYPLGEDRGWDREGFQPLADAPTFDLDDPEVKLIDLDGDGVTDILRSDRRLQCFLSEPTPGRAGRRWTERWIERRSIDVFPDVTFSDPRVKWGDMTGDGLEDVVLVHNGLVEYWPNVGRGEWAPRVRMMRSPQFPDGYDPARILVGDIDGDGVADMAYVDDGRTTIWINRSGNGWSDPIEIGGTPPVSDVDAVRIADMLGTGVAGILWTSDAGGTARDHMFFLDLTGGTKPYVMHEMNNHLGAITRVEYAPSTRYYRDDERDPATRWQTRLPFPVQVIARVEAIDQISGGKLTTEYRYHHGYWDGVEREFAGFGMVETLDTEQFDAYHGPGLHGADRRFVTFDGERRGRFAPPLLSKVWFHQGAVGPEYGAWREVDYSGEYWPGDPPALGNLDSTAAELRLLDRRARRDAARALKGRLLRTELYARDGTPRQDRPYTVVESCYGVVEIDPPEPDDAERPRIFFPHQLAQRATQWERGDDPMTRVELTGGYDAYGQPQLTVTIAVPRGRACNESIPAAAAAPPPYLITAMWTDYAQPVDAAGPYIRNRVARVTTYEVASAATSRLSVAELKGRLDPFDLARVGPLLSIASQTINFYDGPANQGLPFGQIDRFGALSRTDTLVLTEAVAADGYGGPPSPYLALNPPAGWENGYPPDFLARLPAMAGYTFHDGVAEPEYARGYFATAAQNAYDFHDPPAAVTRGLLMRTRSALGAETTVRYEPYALLPESIADALGLAQTALYDYRVLQPRESTDANGNITRYTYTPLGLVRSSAVLGKPGEDLGDTDALPGICFEYDFAFTAEPLKPAAVRSIRRLHHANERDVSNAERHDTIETRQFSDGFGRLIQTRTRGDDVVFDRPLFDAPRFGDAGLRTAAGDPDLEAIAHASPSGGPWIVVSGWQVYDNKGRVVEKYEPFFSAGWDYAPPEELALGAKATIEYDPRGQIVRTINPDGSEQRIVYGVPANLADPSPEHATPTAWTAYTYDAADNAGRTHAVESAAYRHQWDTPTSVVVDALGRTILSEERTRVLQADGTWSAVEVYRTRSTYDIRGNLLSVTDPLGRVVFRYWYDLGNRQIRRDSLDAGRKTRVIDAGGNTIEERDTKGAILLNAYDILSRQVRLWARDDGAGAIRLRERIDYGDDSDRNQAAADRADNRNRNRLGRPSRHYDEAGLLTIESYDFKGNALEKTRQTVADSELLGIFDPPPAGWRVGRHSLDWDAPDRAALDALAARVLDPLVYRTSAAYDALNRIKTLRVPPDAAGGRQLLRMRYARSGLLDRVELGGSAYVERIAYNAKGQRTLIAYGNGVMSRYAYDPLTFRVTRVRTEPYRTADSLSYHGAGAPLQDVSYTHDVGGNVLRITDRTPGCGVLNNPDAAIAADAALATLLASGDALVRRFEYDALNRLTSATGRECGDIRRPRGWPDASRCGFNGGGHGSITQANAPSLTSVYRETYTYDPAGNLLTVRHVNAGRAWTRHFGVGGLTPRQWQAEWPNHLDTAWPNAPSNRLTHVGDDDPHIGATHEFDAAGNLTRETTSRHLEWDYENRLRVFRTQTVAFFGLLGSERLSEPSIHAQYLYDAAGKRVKKLVRTQGGGYQSTVYIEGVFEHHRWRQNGEAPGDNNIVHVHDDRTRIALVRTGAAHPDDRGPAVQYHLQDHLGSSSLVVDARASWINREEYTPYGETSFGSFARKRYRYNGQERDGESGLGYHETRYYAPWLMRWVSCDVVEANNLYAYANQNPMRYTDPHGRQSSDAGVEEPGVAPAVETPDIHDAGVMNQYGELSFPVGSYGSEQNQDLRWVLVAGGITLAIGLPVGGFVYLVVTEGVFIAVFSTGVGLAGSWLVGSILEDAGAPGWVVFTGELAGGAVAGGWAAGFVKSGLANRATLSLLAADEALLRSEVLESPTWVRAAIDEGDNVYIDDFLNAQLQARLELTVADFHRDPIGMAKSVPNNIPYRGFEAYGGQVIEHGLFERLKLDPILSNIIEHVPYEQQVRGGLTGDFRLTSAFEHWDIKPWDVTTRKQLHLKLGKGYDYNWLLYEADWNAVRAVVFH
jgi:RHS repeat-associated protein